MFLSRYILMTVRFVLINLILIGNLIFAQGTINGENKEQDALIQQDSSVEIMKIQNYVVGQLTEDEFFNDGWTPVPAYMGKLGIIEIQGKTDSGTKHLEVKMGSDVNLKLEKGRISENIDAMYDLFKQYSIGTPKVNYKSPDVTNDGKSFNPKLICTLHFKNKILEDIKWHNDNMDKENEVRHIIEQDSIK